MLIDNHGRLVNYLRLAVTDRCNLRCFYCMPEEGNKWLSRDELLRGDEMLRISKILVNAGVEKIRITGGEPFIRKDIMQLLGDLSKLPGLKNLSVTTNGVLTAPLVPELKKIGIRSVNLSLDTLDKNRFFTITHRDEFDKVMNTLDQLLIHNFSVKINAVVMEGKNIGDIIPLVNLTKKSPVEIRFIEEMPFNGEGSHYPVLHWNFEKILDHIRTSYPEIRKSEDEPFGTSTNFQVPGHAGKIGVIAAYSRTFCGTCNRIRITPQGNLKTCLYDGGVGNIRDLMRNGASDEKILTTITERISRRALDGREAERMREPVHESMATIGG
ncbi:MAG: GTP 3',8-cyclase MoaA [Bacteroidetes bacterium]|nr:MAG: GTP 3',8-cyclase MoaA [Bacteroidota bacterium]